MPPSPIRIVRKRSQSNDPQHYHIPYGWVLNNIYYPKNILDLHEVLEDAQTWLAHSRDPRRQRRNPLEVLFR